jgi:hypothetical protein
MQQNTHSHRLSHRHALYVLSATWSGICVSTLDAGERGHSGFQLAIQSLYFLFSTHLQRLKKSAPDITKVLLNLLHISTSTDAECMPCTAWSSYLLAHSAVCSSRPSLSAANVEYIWSFMTPREARARVR